MPAYVALLRAVNVGGTGKLSMPDLAALCRDAGCTEVTTYIASGNVVFTSPLEESGLKLALESRLASLAGRPVGVLVRTAAQMAHVRAANPFPAAPPNLTVAIFLDAPPPEDTLASVRHRNGEKIRLGAREIYVYYPGGQGSSRLQIPTAAAGTARNLNTIAKLASMAEAL